MLAGGGQSRVSGPGGGPLDAHHLTTPASPCPPGPAGSPLGRSSGAQGGWPGCT